MAMFWARITFFAVMGKNAPAFTVASLAMIMKMRPHTRARPVIVPAEGAPPHSSYISQASKIPSSKNCEPGSINLAMRSRAVSRPFLCCDSMAFAPPPNAICSSSFLICVTRSIIRRVFFSNSGDFVFTFVLRIEAATHRPHAEVAAQSDARQINAARRKRHSIRSLQSYCDGANPSTLSSRYLRFLSVTHKAHNRALDSRQHNFSAKNVFIQSRRDGPDFAHLAR